MNTVGFVIKAHHHFESVAGSIRGDLDRPMSVEVTTEVATPELAAEIAAMFPKGCRVRSGPLVGGDTTRGYVSCLVILTANGVNGGRNEAGIKRYRSVRRAIDKLGHSAIWDAGRANNAYATEADFENAIA